MSQGPLCCSAAPPGGGCRFGNGASVNPTPILPVAFAHVPAGASADGAVTAHAPRRRCKWVSPGVLRRRRLRVLMSLLGLWSGCRRRWSWCVRRCWWCCCSCCCGRTGVYARPCGPASPPNPPSALRGGPSRPAGMSPSSTGMSPSSTGMSPSSTGMSRPSAGTSRPGGLPAVAGPLRQLAPRQVVQSLPRQALAPPHALRVACAWSRGAPCRQVWPRPANISALLTLTGGMTRPLLLRMAQKHAAAQDMRRHDLASPESRSGARSFNAPFRCADSYLRVASLTLRHRHRSAPARRRRKLCVCPRTHPRHASQP